MQIEKPARVLLAKTGLDGHWRGVSLVARCLRDAGFEVIMIGMSQPEEIFRAAIDEDPDLVGLSVGGHVDVVLRIIEGLTSERPELPIFVGGAIAPWAKRKIEEQGVEVYPPGSSLDDIAEAAGRLTGVIGQAHQNA